MVVIVEESYSMKGSMVETVNMGLLVGFGDHIKC